MSRFKIVNLIDKVFITVAVFLFYFAWVNFYIRNLWATFFISLIASGATIFVLNYFLSKKATKKAKTIKENAEINKNFFIFKLLPNEEKLKLLKKTLSKNAEVVLKNGVLTFTKNEKTHLVLILANAGILNQNSIIEKVCELLFVKVDVISIVCEGAQNVNPNLFCDKKIEIIDKFMLYDMFKQANIYPSGNNINTTATKLKFKDVLIGIFAPQKAKSYFFCGLLLIGSSIILPYFIYYVIVGSMLMLFSVICKILPKFIN